MPPLQDDEMKITKRQLRRIIKEEKQKLLSEDISNHEMYASDDELRKLGDAIESLVHWTVETNRQMDEMALRYGELAASTTRTVRIANEVEELADRYDQALDDMIRFR
jgi:methyl-accepting chemotaxis protein